MGLSFVTQDMHKNMIYIVMKDFKDAEEQPPLRTHPCASWLILKGVRWVSLNFYCLQEGEQRMRGMHRSFVLFFS